MINLTTSLTISNPNKINGNARDGVKYTSESFTSNLEVFIKNIEKIIPRIRASNTCGHSTRNSGMINIQAPVLIIIGGKIIFFIEAGLFAAFNRMKIINTAIPAKTIVLEINQNIDIKHHSLEALINKLS